MAGFGFPADLHLKRPADFRAVFDGGGKRHSRAFIFFRLANGLEVSRLGVAVGRKVGGAVVRNRVKRRVREAFRLQWRALGLGGSDLVVVAKRGAPGLSGAEVAAELAAGAAARRVR